MEFLHQTLIHYIIPDSEAHKTFPLIYQTISQSYNRKGGAGGMSELESDIKGLKDILSACKKSTALQFLCFREGERQVVRDRRAGVVPAQAQAGSGSAAPASSTPKT